MAGLITVDVETYYEQKEILEQEHEIDDALKAIKTILKAKTNITCV